MSGGRLGVLLLLAAGACATAPPDPDAPAQVGPVPFVLREEARDGVWTVPPGAGAKVDRDARLVLAFTPPPPPDAAPPGEEWQAIQEWLDGMDRLAGRLQSMHALALRGGEEADLAAFLQAAQELETEVAEAVEKGRNLMVRSGLDPARATRIVLGTEPGYPGSRLENITRWMRRRQEELLVRARALRKQGERQVAILAFRRVRGRLVERLPVENYDTLAAGSDLPLERSFLGLSPWDLRRFRSELAQARRAVATVENIQDRLRGLLAEQGALLRELWSSVAKVLGAPAGEEGAAGLRAAVEAMQASPEAEEEAVAAELGELSDLADQGRQLAAIWEELLDVDGARGLLDVADRLQDLAAILGRVEAWQRRARELAGRLEERAEMLADLPERAREPLRRLAAEGGGAMTRARAILQGIAAEVVPTRALVEATQGDRTLPRDVDELVDGRIFLTDRVDPGDSVLIRVELREPPGRDGQSGRAVAAVEYDLQVEELGLRARLQGAPMLARGSGGPPRAQSWKPNVVALWSWHYRLRHPSGAGRVWNWLDPSLGIHAASLDQGSDNVEFGLGFQVGFWDSLLFLGAGWNLNVGRDELYWMVGSDLFRVLGEIGGGR